MFFENTEDLAQNKLLLLYIIDKSEIKLKNTLLTDFILRHDLMNYFLIQQYLSELKEGDFINLLNEEERKVYEITEKGKNALEIFNERIPEEYKKIVDNALSNLPKRPYNSDAKVLDLDGIRGVNLELSKEGEVLFDLYLKVQDKEQAMIIKENWEKRADEIYIEILERLL